jgi:6-pyruvoyltetrahydropterin/6-carboxytetrahydropterin synthase
MYEISVEKHFDAAHYLRDYKGKCENLHGHRYTIIVKVSAEKLNDIGIAYDFADLKRHLNDILARYDHTCLNDVPPFDKINPSAENIASTIYAELKKSLGAARDKKLGKEVEAPFDAVQGKPALSAVEVWESPEQGVAFRPS